MFDSIRQSLGLSPTKATSQLPPETGHDDGYAQWEPSVWGRLEVENRKGKVTGTLPITRRDCTIGR